MKHSLLAMAILGCSASGWAGNIHYVNSGPAVTVGAASNAQLSSSGKFNPAAISLNTQTSRIGVAEATIGFEMEGLGSFNTVFEDLSDQINVVTDTFDDYENDEATTGDVLAAVDDLETSFDENLSMLSDRFYFTGNAYTSILSPVAVDMGRYGTFSIGLSSLTQARASILHDTLEFDIDAQEISDASENDEDLEPTDYLDTTSSLYLKQGQVFNVDLAWAHVLPQIEFTERFGIQATGGLRATIIGYNLQKNLYPIKDLIESVDEDSGELMDDISDDVTDIFTSDMNYTVALDAGITLQRNNTLVGLTVYNLNNPTLEYEALGGDCASISDSDDQSECYHAEYFASIGDIALNESHSMSPTVTLDAVQGFKNNRIALSGAIDLLPTKNVFGDEHQDFALGVLLQPNSWYWPRLRMGLGKDLTDLDPTRLAVGVTLFNFLQVDSQMTAVLGDLFSDDDTEAGDAIRSASVSASINIAF
ncbi:conjugal transfer protein TraF [Reinekea marinisedimentorum]|uniref:F plasmid transfer operon protein TraF n=1 Tax=Reinekea marinisedimentorum TaxID=230495 RepID=A0A4R3HXR3_9GAMM|nr:conjugal transfer protein TraF [Reinekea marinisedimentorum]TCS38137.1 F plasmid transfer operon protein TraF [Reinekea marinisedimentorum]